MLNGTPLPAPADEVFPHSSFLAFLLGYLFLVMLVLLILPEGSLKRLAFGNPHNSEDKR